MHIHRSLIRVCALPAKHTRADIYYTRGGAGGLGLHPGRPAAAADVTAHKQFGLVHPRVRRSNELAAASEMHPFYQRCARRGRRGHGPPAVYFSVCPRCSCALEYTYIYVYMCVIALCITLISMQLGSFFELACSRKRLGRGIGKRFIRYIALFFFPPFSGGSSLDESSFLAAVHVVKSISSSSICSQGPVIRYLALNF